MNETIKSILIIALLVIVVILLGVIAYYHFRKRHTKEKFAFFSVITLSTLTITTIFPILNGQSIWAIVIYALNNLFALNIPLKEPTIYEQALSVLILYLISKTIIDLHDNWDSKVKTEREFENSRKNISSSILSDFTIQLKNFFSSKDLLKLYSPDKKKVTYNFLGELNYSKIPWHQNVAEILPLISNQYSIDIDKDWFSEHNCFISEFGKNKETICIFCSIKEPVETEITSILNFIKKRKYKIDNLIIAIEEETNSTKLEYQFKGMSITKRYKNELLDNLVNFTTYYRYIKRRFYEEEVSLGTSKTLNDIYVSLGGFSEKDHANVNNVESLILDWVEDNSSNKHLAILGDYGQGKSVLSLKVATALIEKNLSRVPILIELRGKSPRNLSLLEILATWSSNFRLDPLAILKLHFEGKLILIFEGFDEMDLVGDAEMRLNHFRNLWEFAKSPKSKILITGRPNFFLDNTEQKEALGINSPISQDVPHCEAVYLKSFSKPQIKEALRNSNSQTKNGILQIIGSSSENNDRFYDLVSRPATLFLISSIWKKAKFSQRKDKINSAIVIREFIQSAYERQGKKGNRTPLTVKEREYFMMGIAVGMMRLNGYSNQISKSKLNELISTLYENFPNDMDSTSSAFEETRKPLKERIKGNEEIAKESLLTDVRSCGILVKDLGRINHFKFAHKSFMEYLVSEYYVISLLGKDDEKTSMYYSINKSIENSTLIKESKETTDFVSQLLASEFFEENIENKELTAKKIVRLLHKSKLIKPHFLSFIYSHIRPIMYTTMIFMMAVMLIYVYLIRGETDGNKLFFDSENSFLTSFSFILINFFVVTVTYYLGRLRRQADELNTETDNPNNIGFPTKIKIWYLSCKELGISDENLEKVIYRKYINKIKEQINSAHNKGYNVHAS